MTNPGFIHNVYFWLTPEATDGDRTAFEAGLRDLGICRTIGSYYYGKPAGTPREVVDNSYDYSLVITFANKGDHDAYQDDPIHHEFIEKYKHLWARVRVYDVVPV